MKKAFSFLILVSLGLIFSQVPSASEQLTVQYNLSGQVQGIENNELIVVFSDDMIALGDNPDGARFLKIEPACEGRYFWRGTKTLVFQPKTRFRYSSLYRATVPAGVAGMSGGILNNSMTWVFITRLAHPVEFATKSLKVLRPLQNGQEITSAYWPKDPLYLRFNQPVSAKEVKRLLTIAGEKPISVVRFPFFSKAKDIVAIRFSSKLKRGERYKVQLAPGFCGREGNRGTEKEFAFSFVTVPHFRLMSPEKSSIPCDEPVVRLNFSNRLDEKAQKKWRTKIKAMLDRQGRMNPVKFKLAVTGNMMYLQVDESLLPGDLMNIDLPRGISNIYAEKLPRDEKVSVRICSAVGAGIGINLEKETPEIWFRSQKAGDIALYRFSEALLSDLDCTAGDPRRLPANQGKFGFLCKEAVAKKLLLQESAVSLAGPDDGVWQKREVDLQRELGGTLGFFGFLTKRSLPHNSCGQQELYLNPLTSRNDLHIVHRRTIDFLMRTGPDQTLFWGYDRRTGAGVEGGRIELRRGGEKMDLGVTGNEGLFRYLGALRPGDIIIFRRDGTTDFAFRRISGEPYVQGTDHCIELFSERSFYSPGEEVHIGGVVKEYCDGKVIVAGEKTVSMKVLDPDRRSVFQDKLDLDDFGGFYGVFKSSPDGKKGRYCVVIQGKDWKKQIEITIDHFQPDTFEVSIGKLESHYLCSDTFNSNISGAYLSGNPLAGDKLEFWLRSAPGADLSGLALPDAISGFDFSLDEAFQRHVQEYSKKTRFDYRGNVAVKVDLKFFRKLNCVGRLFFSAIGNTVEGKEYRVQASSLLLPGRRLCGLKLPFLNPAKSEVKAELLLLDDKGQKVSGTVKLGIYQRYRKAKKWRVRQVGEDTMVNIAAGNGGHSFLVPMPGEYFLKAEARDNEGNVTSSSRNFHVWESGRSWVERPHLELHSDNDSPRIGDQQTCFLSSPRGGQALITVEGEDIKDAWTIDAKRTTPITFTVKREYFPTFRVNVYMVMGDGRLQEIHRDFTVRDSRHRLKVKIEAPDEVKPVSGQSLKIHVTDEQKRGTRAKLFVYAVDEGCLSLTGYQTPDWHDSIYYKPLLSRTRTFLSSDCRHFLFKRPLMDIELVDPGLFGCVMLPDGTPVPGVGVSLKETKTGRMLREVTSAGGYYYFRNLAAGKYETSAEKGDQISPKYEVEYDTFFCPRDMVLLPRGLAAANEVSLKVSPEDDYGKRSKTPGGRNYWNPVLHGPGIGDTENLAGSSLRDITDQENLYYVDGVYIAPSYGIRVRADFREVLFFKQVETDERGEAEVEFQTSDQLSTYRIMAVAYDADSYGSAEKRLLVSKDLLLSEAMPEFARSGDAFSAGVQVSNRTGQKLEVQVLAEPKLISVEGEKQKKTAIASRANLLVPFRFRVGAIGPAEVTFYALSALDKDGLLKKLPVTDDLVPESQLDFDFGREMTKRIHAQEGAEEQKLKLAVASSILKPAGKVAEKLVFYPYECLEQRTSKVLPYLVLSPDLAGRMGLQVDLAQVRREVEGYIKIVPEFQHGDGGLCYYRGGQWSSDYLTLYVLWALHLAKRADYAVDQALISRLEGRLSREKLYPYCDAFFQFVLSLGKRADAKKLKSLYEGRDRLSLPARVFLYRALGFQPGDRAKQRQMYGEFKNGLQVEADFAYFDAREFTYDRDLPFYSSRYGTALLLQAILEWEDDFVLAPRVMNWLLEARPYEWHTTQTNFWILYAAAGYIAKVEKGGATQARAEVLGKVEEKRFAGPQDVWKLEREIAPRQADFDVKVSGDQMVYLTSELNYKLRRPPAASRGITVARSVYGADGKRAAVYKKGNIYMVELLIRMDKEVPYAVVDEPLAAGFEVLRQDVATTRDLKEFNRDSAKGYWRPWLRQENSADRTVFYSYGLQGRVRVVYFVKAMYSGEFTWLPCVVQGMYHPQYFGRCATGKITVSE